MAIKGTRSFRTTVTFVGKHQIDLLNRIKDRVGPRGLNAHILSTLSIDDQHYQLGRSVPDHVITSQIPTNAK